MPYCLVCSNLTLFTYRHYISNSMGKQQSINNNVSTANQYEKRKGQKSKTEQCKDITIDKTTVAQKRVRMLGSNIKHARSHTLSRSPIHHRIQKCPFSIQQDDVAVDGKDEDVRVLHHIDCVLFFPVFFLFLRTEFHKVWLVFLCGAQFSLAQIIEKFSSVCFRLDRK